MRLHLLSGTFPRICSRDFKAYIYIPGRLEMHDKKQKVSQLKIFFYDNWKWTFDTRLVILQVHM